MDINDVLDGIVKSINRFAGEIAEQWLQEKMRDTGRGPENRDKTRRPWMAGEDSRKAGPSGREAGTAQRNAESFEVKETTSQGAILDCRRLVAKRQATGKWPATRV